MRTLTLLALLALPLAADTVICKNPARTYVGKVTEATDEHVKIQFKNGAVTIPRYQIEKIEYGATPDEVYADRHARADASKKEELLDLAQWCLKNGLKKEANAEFERVLQVDPENSVARETLGYVRVDGAWMTQEQAAKARGLVEYEGMWVTPEEAKLKQALKDRQDLEKKLRDKVRDCLRKLTSADGVTRQDARDTLDRIPPEYKFDPLLENIDNRSAEVRAYCVGALSTYDRPEMIPKLAHRLLVDESEAIRSAASEALKKLNNPDTWISLQKGLLSESSVCRIRAANALCDFPNERAAEALINALVRVEKPEDRPFTSETTGGVDPRLLGKDGKLSPEAKKALDNGMKGADDPDRKAKEEQKERERAAIVRSLEACTGLKYGEDVAAWREWYLAKHAAAAAKGQMGDTEKKDEGKPGDGEKPADPDKPEAK